MAQTTISIVDDDHSVREATEGLLRSFGYAAETFANGDDFLTSGAVERTRCLVLDVQMPRLDGFDVQSCLKLMGRKLPIIFITAYPNDRVRARALEGGAVSFLAKPFSADELMTAITAAVEQGSDQV